MAAAKIRRVAGLKSNGMLRVDASRARDVPATVSFRFGGHASAFAKWASAGTLRFARPTVRRPAGRGDLNWRLGAAALECRCIPEPPAD